MQTESNWDKSRPPTSADFLALESGDQIQTVGLDTNLALCLTIQKLEIKEAVSGNFVLHITLDWMSVSRRIPQTCVWPDPDTVSYFRQRWIMDDVVTEGAQFDLPIQGFRVMDPIDGEQRSLWLLGRLDRALVGLVKKTDTIYLPRRNVVPAHFGRSYTH